MAKKPSYRAGRDQAATAENVELLTGQRGDRLDKAVTFRELAALGLSTLRPGAGGVYVPSKNPDLFPPGQMEFPHAPVNVIANGAFHTVLVEWDPPQYRGHAHAEIWRAESDNQASASLVGTSSANLFSDAIGKGATFYYWVRFVNGKDDKGPFQGMQGVKAETSRDVQDILDELQGKIEESHLAQTLLGPIEQVPQLQLDIAILKPKVAAIEDKIPSIEQELAGLDERQKVAQELLDDAQQQLGMSSIEIGLVQDRLNAKLDKYKGDFDSFRDAAFVVDPENGSITMDAVNAVREELHTSITEVHQQIDAVAGQISSKADNVTVDGQGSRITEAEQRINGLDASLSQTVTRGEFTGEQQRVTQIGQELDATKGELTQKATKQEVDAQGVRLANAESKLTAHTDELSSQAQRLDGLAAQVTLGDATLQANITELARVTAESDQVTAQRVSGLEVRAGTSEAKIQALEEIIEDDGGITAGRFDTIIAELELQRGLDDDNASAAIDGALAVDERDRETRKAFGSIRTEQRVILTEQQAQAQRTIDIDVKFEAKDAATQARISSVEKVTSDADSALAQRIENVTAEFKAADTALAVSLSESSKALADADRALGERISTLDVTVGENSASITELRQAVVSNEESLSQRQDKMESEIGIGAISQVEGALTGDERDRENRKARGVILQQQSTLANQQEAQARTVEQLTAEFDAENAEIRAQITNEQLVRSTADEALAQKTSVLEAQIEGVNQSLSASIAEVSRVSADADAAMTEKLNQQQSTMQTADAELSSRINEEATTRADAVESLASQIQQVTANYQQGDKQLQGQITAESVARADAMQALGSQIDTVSAVAGSKNKTFFQATAPGSAMGTGDLWFDTANNNRPYRYSGTAWVATDDPRIAANAASIQTQSQAIADLQNGAQAMWTAKASAGQITAGIGLIAKSDGTSQVVVSASQFFVFNPNSPSTTAPLFAIDNGQAVIDEAIIRKATIQILNAEKIAADYVKAGVSISSPLINGGQIDMGNAFMSGGAAGFGKGGPYGGWGWGWYTMIYADGSIYTNRLHAEGGYVRNMTIGNCTIEQDCVVKGTIYAERIVGDVAAIKSLNQNISGPTDVTFFVPAISNMDRDIVVSGINVQVSGYTTGGGGDHSDKDHTVSVDVSFFLNGYHQSTFSASATGRYRKDSCHPSFHFRLPKGQPAAVVIRFSGGGGYITVNMSGAIAMVTKVGSATFG
ncbi:phage tail tip fiber protein [Aeromonas caviae]|uniref:phage tail tip fiber protein n=1 Tax=Aeromonas caviae TaxID=648 RepID=UPI003988BFF4